MSRSSGSDILHDDHSPMDMSVIYAMAPELHLRVADGDDALPKSS